MRRLILALALSSALGCSYKRRIKHLSDAEFDHYYALKVYMEEDQRKEYLKLETEEERNAYLKEFMLPGIPPKSLWDTFYEYEPHIREKIVAGDVQEGWTVDMMFMSWGKPIESRKLPGRKAERSVLYTYRFEQQPDGSIFVWVPDSKTQYKAVRMFEREVIADDDIIAEIRDK